MKQLTWINLKIYVNYKIKGVYYFVNDFNLYEVWSYEFEQKFSLKFLENINIGRSIIIQGNIKMEVNRLNPVQKATYFLKKSKVGKMKNVQ